MQERPERVSRPSVFLWSLFLLPFFSLQCAATLPEKGVPNTGTFKKKMDIKVMGSRRYYLLHIPKGYDFSETAPLVLVLMSWLAGAWLLIPALLLHIAGVLALRWLFFAEAEHVQALYYGQR